MSIQQFVCLVLLSLTMFPQTSLAEERAILQKVGGEDFQWWLPDYLKEASGIAVLDDQSLLVHDDEFAVVYRVSLTDYSVEPFGWLGSPEFERDFEGVALAGNTIYLVSSEGFIYEALVDIAGRSQSLEFTRFDTGLKSICELEGLHYQSGKLLLPCKVPREPSYMGKLVVFELDIATKRVSKLFELPGEHFGPIEGPMPTAIAVDGSHYYLISTNYLLQIDTQTLSTSVYSLPKSHHFQPEGIGILKDGSIVIVDDVRKSGLSKLTHYPGLEVLEQLR